MIYQKNVRHFSVRQVSEFSTDYLAKLLRDAEKRLDDAAKNHDWIMAAIAVKKMTALDEYNEAEKKVNKLNGLLKSIPVTDKNTKELDEIFEKMVEGLKSLMEEK